MTKRLSAGGIAAVYAILGGLWITASDRLMSLIIDSPALLVRVGIIKGLGFVLFTACLFYFLLRARSAPPALRDISGSNISLKRGRRYILLTFFGLALGAPLLGYGIYRLHGPQVEREAYGNLMAIARLKVEEIEAWLSERRGDAQALANSPGFAELMGHYAEGRDEIRLKRRLLDRLENVRSAYAYEHIMAVAADGRILAATGPEVRVPEEIRGLLDLAQQTRQVQFSDLYRDKQGEVHLDWVVPMAASDGRTVGSIVLRIAPERFLFPLIQTWPTASASAESLLVRREGDAVAYLNSLRHLENPALSLRIPLGEADLPTARAVLNGGIGVMRGIDYRGNQVLAAYQPVQGTTWHLVAKVDRDEVLAPVWELVVWVSLFAFFTVLFSSSALLMLWRQRQRAHQWEMAAHTAAAVAESEARLRAILDNAPLMVFMKDTAGRFLLANRNFKTTFGLSDEEIQGKSEHDLFPTSFAEALLQNERKVLEAQEPLEAEEQIPYEDGIHTYLSIKFPLSKRSGEIYAICGIATDITERKAAEAKIQRLTRIYAVLSQCNQAIVRSKDEQQLFPEICRSAVHYGGMNMAWIGLVDSASRRVRPVAFAGEGEDFLNDIEIAVDDESPLAHGPTGMAIRENRPCWYAEFLHVPETAPWHASASRFGWNAAAALPIRRQGVAVGAFTLYDEDIGAFDQDVQGLLMEMAADLEFALDKFALEGERRKAEESLRESEARFHTLAMSAPVGIFRTDAAGLCIFVNQAWCVLSGTTLEQALGHDWRDQVAAEDLGQVTAAWENSIREGRPFKLEFRLQGAGGRIFWVIGRAEAERNGSGKIMGYIGTITDITALKLQQESLRQAAVVFENSREGIMVTDEKERIVLVNRAFSQMTGYSLPEALGKTPRLLASGHHDREFFRKLWRDLQMVGHWQGEVWNRRKTGEVFPGLLSISAVQDESGKAIQFVGIMADISQLKDAAKQLDFLAHHDPLTGLPNRLMMFARLQHSLEMSQREHKRLALLMLDLDRFKDVNDSFGHLAGDELLKQVAKRLTSRLRGIDTVTRLGGDEFAVLLEDLSHPQDAATIATEIIEALNEPWRLSNGVEVRIGTSVGIALFPEQGGSSEELVQHADAALYRAKEEGRGNFKYFSDDLTNAARRRINLESLLRRALRRGELRVHYQPQIDMGSGAIVGAEALVRWANPEAGIILPGSFIAVAEQSGLIGDIGVWVLREACRQGREWLDAGLPPLNMAVNLSPYQFRYGDIRSTVAAILAETGFPPERLELELTESALMERETDVVELLQTLQDLGVRLAIDDFGTGYSSLAYLKRFPLDVLKIDKSFIDDIPLRQGDMEIAAAIIALGHTLQLRVLAEGVETPEQLEFLKEKGCDLFQGFLRSKPLTAEEFLDLFAASHGYPGRGCDSESGRGSTDLVRDAQPESNS